MGVVHGRVSLNVPLCVQCGSVLSRGKTGTRSRYPDPFDCPMRFGRPAKIAPAEAAETMVLARFSRPVWHLVDARDQTVGRMSSQIVKVLLGKHKPTFNPSTACGDYVVIINAKEAYFTGRKKDDKLYTWHTGYPGGIKQKSVAKTLDDKPEEVGPPSHFRCTVYLSVTCTRLAILFSTHQVLRKSILGMLRKNTLRHEISRRLRIFPGDKHLHEDMIPAGTPSILQ
jgi:large subunit ribosomal protein L13